MSGLVIALVVVAVLLAPCLLAIAAGGLIRLFATRRSLRVRRASLGHVSHVIGSRVGTVMLPHAYPTGAFEIETEELADERVEIRATEATAGATGVSPLTASLLHTVLHGRPGAEDQAGGRARSVGWRVLALVLLVCSIPLLLLDLLFRAAWRRTITVDLRAVAPARSGPRTDVDVIVEGRGRGTGDVTRALVSDLALLDQAVHGPTAHAGNRPTRPAEAATSPRRSPSVVLGILAVILLAVAITLLLARARKDHGDARATASERPVPITTTPLPSTAAGQPTATATATTAAPPAVAPEAPDVDPIAGTPRAEMERVVRRYWLAQQRRDFATARSLLAERTREARGTLEQFTAAQAPDGNIDVEFTRLNATASSADSGRVDATLRTDTGAGCRLSARAYTVAQLDGQWRILAEQIESNTAC